MLAIPEPLPGTCGLNKIDDAINLELAGDTGSDFSVDDEYHVRCCDKWEPEALQTMADVTFVG